MIDNIFFYGKASIHITQPPTSLRDLQKFSETPITSMIKAQTLPLFYIDLLSSEAYLPHIVSPFVSLEKTLFR